jgi:glycosyltransferase involved in cell wall biosynthesis
LTLCNRANIAKNASAIKPCLIELVFTTIVGEEQKDRSTANELLSIIIPTYNTAPKLRHCLQSIRNQSYRDIEVVVVDKTGNDDTENVSKSFGAKIIRSSQERSGARNAGLAESRGSMVLSVDSDMLLSKDLAKECARLLHETGVAVIVPEIDLCNTYWGRVFAFRRLSSWTRPSESIYGHPRGFRSDDLRKVGGWDPTIVAAEDADLQIRLKKNGTRLVVAKNYFCHDIRGMSLSGLVQKWIFYRRSQALFYAKYKMPPAPSGSFFLSLKGLLPMLVNHPREGLGYIFALWLEFLINTLLFYRL